MWPVIWFPLTKGEHVGVISEAGCPAVADPGADIVAIAQRKNYPVVLVALVFYINVGNGFRFQRAEFCLSWLSAH